MDQGSQENLQRIIALPPHMLVEEDKRFLHSRRDYLTRSQREDFAEVIDEVTEWNSQLKDDKGKLIKQPKDQKPQDVQQVEQAPQQPAKTEYQDKDTHLNLDKPNGEQNAAGGDQGSQDVECLDPDCTHENHTQQPNP